MLFSGYDGSAGDKRKLYELILKLGDIDADNDQEKEKLFFFWDNFVPLVSGACRYRAERAQGKRPSRALTAQDEAWAVLNWENNFEYWEDEYVGKQADGKYRSQISPKYTRKEGTRGIQKGWSEEGEQRYDELLGLVIKDRKTEKRKQLEREYMALGISRSEKYRGAKAKKKDSVDAGRSVDMRKNTNRVLMEQLRKEQGSDGSSDDEDVEVVDGGGNSFLADGVVEEASRRAAEVDDDSSEDEESEGGVQTTEPV